MLTLARGGQGRCGNMVGAKSFRGKARRREGRSSMPVEIGHVEAIFRYPVKSMGGESLTEATLGWHGLAGDRRLAFRRMNDCSGFPWLSASQLPALLLF